MSAMPEKSKPSRKQSKLGPYFAQRWEFVRKLKIGGQATTLVVRERATGEIGVLKQPKNPDPITTERFRREIAIVQECSHPAIVRLLDFSLDPQQLGYVSPRGETLKEYWDRMRAGKSATEVYDQAYAFMASIADGLAVLHDNGVVHRDLKAANVIVLSGEKMDQPVVIDFGLAFREGDDRLSVVDGRMVNNVDTSPAESYYQHISPTPAWDCIGLGWLWGYLVGSRRPDSNRFHWKYHPLLNEPRAVRVRALLALCSDLNHAPENARFFRQLMNNLGLSETPQKDGSDTMDFSKAATALKEAQAARRIREIEQAEQLQIVNAAYRVPLIELRTTLDDRIDQASEMPITRVNPSQTGRSFDEHFQAAFKGDEPGTVAFFWVRCGASQSNNFYICGYLEYDPRNRQPKEILFNLRFDCRHKKNLWNLCDRFYFMRDGSFTDSRSGTKRQVSIAEIVDHVSEWLVRPQHWFAIE